MSIKKTQSKHYVNLKIPESQLKDRALTFNGTTRHGPTPREEH